MIQQSLKNRYEAQGGCFMYISVYLQSFVFFCFFTDVSSFKLIIHKQHCLIKLC